VLAPKVGMSFSRCLHTGVVVPCRSSDQTATPQDSLGTSGFATTIERANDWADGPGARSGRVTEPAQRKAPSPDMINRGTHATMAKTGPVDQGLRTRRVASDTYARLDVVDQRFGGCLQRRIAVGRERVASAVGRSCSGSLRVRRHLVRKPANAALAQMITAIPIRARSSPRSNPVRVPPGRGLTAMKRVAEQSHRPCQDRDGQLQRSGDRKPDPADHKSPGWPASALGIISQARKRKAHGRMPNPTYQVHGQNSRCTPARPSLVIRSAVPLPVRFPIPLSIRTSGFPAYGYR